MFTFNTALTYTRSAMLIATVLGGTAHAAWAMQSISCQGVLVQDDTLHLQPVPPFREIGGGPPWCDADISDEFGHGAARLVLATCKVDEWCEIKGVVDGHGTWNWVKILSVRFLIRAADALPSEFLGSWTRLSVPERALIDIDIGRRSFDEPGYHCQINGVTKSVDDEDAGNHVYLIDMICRDEGGPHRVHEVWAMRTVNGKDVLVISGATSIQVLQREPANDARK
jgi:hypothetical protein